MNKSELLEWLQYEHAVWKRTIDLIPAERWNEPGVAGFWTMKDVLAHLTGWNRRIVADVQAVSQGQPKPPPPWPAELEEDDDVNAWFYQNDHERPLDDLLVEERQVFEALLAAVESYPDDVEIETKFHEGRPFYLLHFGGERLHPGEFFDHYRDDHAAEVLAWLVSGN